jgi:sigma-B regulation protein RsbU (phosphoserine phosphatase)
VSVPQGKGLDLAVFMRPAKAVGGDLYNFVILDDDKIGVMVGDVSGKGTPAALFMAKVVSEFKFFARAKTDPAEVLAGLNRSLASESTGGLFVTLTYVIFDNKTNRALFCNGGHLPMILARADGQAQFLAGEEGMPMGVIDDAPFSNAEIQTRPGDCIAFYSDGVSEARNRKKEEFGAETLKEYLLKNNRLTAQEIVNSLVSNLDRFVGKADPHDDITLIIAKIGPGNGK